MSRQAKDTLSVLSKNSLKSLSFVGHGTNTKNYYETIDEELQSHRSGSTRISGSASRTMHGGDTSNSVEYFLQGMSPDLRRVLQKITGSTSLKKQISDMVVKKGSQDWTHHISAFQKKITLRKNVQNKLYIKSLGTSDKIHADKDRM